MHIAHTHKQSSRVNEVLEFLKATPGQRQTLFYSSSHPSVLPSFLTSSRQFCMWVLSSLLPPFTWLSSLRSELDSNPLSATHRSTEPQKMANGYSTPEACFKWFHHSRPSHCLMRVGLGFLAWVASRCSDLFFATMRLVIRKNYHYYQPSEPVTVKILYLFLFVYTKKRDTLRFLWK